ncbi:nuclease-related domain-containing protein [Aquibacillus kalidii]|uniref:nuclease-related domain-containing protein n=1 Tax=Aquibacillus kalidii TaxID=2762597 RepID=UPI001646D3FF|nr:nuclease-related domain-containing protein [Aquibacillus kalidii]
MKNSYPRNIKGHEALLRRLDSHHYQYPVIEDNLRKYIAGFRGEEIISYQLRRLPSNRFLVLKDLRLQFNSQYFQIDFLVICVYFLLIIEAKNIAGTLFFDKEFNQMIRTYNETEEGFRNPLNQVFYHQDLLSSWLSAHHFTFTPIKSLVAIANPSTILKSNAENDLISSKVVHAEELVARIMKLEKRCENTKPLTNTSELAQILLDNSAPLFTNLLEKYNIPLIDIQTGVVCPSCSSRPMTRVTGSWHCDACFTNSKDAHILALEDYLLLISPSITNYDCRKFLHLESRKVAHKLMSSMGLTCVGTKKGAYFTDAQL